MHLQNHFTAIFIVLKQIFAVTCVKV